MKALSGRTQLQHFWRDLELCGIAPAAAAFIPSQTETAKELVIDSVPIAALKSHSSVLARFLLSKITLELSKYYLRTGSIELHAGEHTVSLTHFLPSESQVSYFGFGKYQDRWFVAFIMGNQPLIFGVYSPHEDRAYVTDYKESRLSLLQAMAAELDLHILQRGELLKTFLSAPPSRFGVLVKNSHVGHNLWNELTGIDGLLQTPSASRIEKVYVTPGCEMYGPVDSIFPALNGHTLRGVKAKSRVHVALTDCVSVVPCGGLRIAASLADRICAIAQLAESELLQDLTHTQPSGALKILFGLRVENRYLLNQGQAFAAIIRALVLEFGKLVALFDGHNTALDGAAIRSYKEFLSTHHNEAPGAMREREIVAEVRALLSDLIDQGLLVVHDTINSPVSASVASALWCDGFISHWGAGLAKVKWIANKPGLVFSARHVLENKHDLRIYDDTKIREGATKLDFVPVELVEDIASSNESSGAAAGNYRCFQIETAPLVRVTIEWARSRLQARSLE